MNLSVDIAYTKIGSFKLYLQETVTAMETIPEAEVESNSQLIILEVEKYTSSIVRELCISIISGEYFINTEIIKGLDDCETEIKDIPRYANTLSYEVQKRALESSNAINIIIESYKIFVKDIIDRYSEEQNFYLFAQNTYLEDVLDGSDFSEDYEKFINYFLVIIAVIRLENFPTTHKEYIMEVFEYDTKIDKYLINEYADISSTIKTKIKFLKHKWKKRIENINPYHYNYLEGGTIKSIEDFDENNLQLKKWAEIIETQYDLISSNWRDIIKKRIKPYKNKPLEQLSILEIHQKIKYYKDVKPNLSKLEEIAHFLNKKADTINEDNCFDKYAYNIAYNYAISNVFSLFLTKEKEIEKVVAKYKKIREDIKGSVNNYFLRFKYLEYIINYLYEKILKDEKKIDFINAHSLLIEECQEEMQEYSNDIDWAKLNFNYVFILPFEECFAPCGIVGLEKAFYPSSFVLPPSIMKTERDYKAIKEKYDNLILSYNTGRYFKAEIEKIEELGKNLDSKDFKAIEIISIFTAIITFVLSSIPAYKFIDSVWESLLFMLSLATALSVFVTLVLFSTRDLYKKWYAYIPVILLIAVTFFGYLNLTQFEKQKIIVNKNLAKNIDSISIKKIDSIINVKIKSTPQKKQGGKTNSKTNGK